MKRQYLTTAKELGQGPFWKVLKEDLVHNGFKYVVGENVDTNPWNPSGTCSPGGLYFTDTPNVVEFLSWGTHIGQVTLDLDEPVWVEEEFGTVKYKAHKLHLGDVKAVREWCMWEDDCFCLVVVKQNGRALQFVKNPTPDICWAAVNQHGSALQFVKNPTPEICLAAVRNYGSALEFVHDQTPEICLAAVTKHGWALRFVHNQTPDICLVAVEQNGWSLDFVKNQTPEICLAAVKRDGSVVMRVKNLTSEICLAASD